MSQSTAPPPQQVLMQMATGKWVSKALGVVADLGIADLLANGPRGIADLAAATGTNTDGLYRLVRAMTAFGVFTELPEKRFANSPLSEPLRSDVPGSLRAMARWIAEAGAWEAWNGLDYSVRTGKPAFDHVHGQQVFEYFQAHPATGQIFNDAMVSLTSVTGPAVAAAYDFGRFNTLVDVGGGHGALLVNVCQRHRGVSGIVFDRPEVVAGVPAFVAAQGLSDRISARGGDFLAGVPEGADAYILKHIIHDWDDEHSVRILAHCRAALAPGGRVLIVEQVVSDTPDAVFSKLIDLEMLVMTTGGRERTAAEFEALLGRAGLKLTAIVRTESMNSIVESVVA